MSYFLETLYGAAQPFCCIFSGTCLFLYCRNSFKECWVASVKDFNVVASLQCFVKWLEHLLSSILTDQILVDLFRYYYLWFNSIILELFLQYFPPKTLQGLCILISLASRSLHKGAGLPWPPPGFPLASVHLPTCARALALYKSRSFFLDRGTFTPISVVWACPFSIFKYTWPPLRFFFF